MLTAYYDASGSGRANTFHVLRRVGPNIELELWLRATDVSMVRRVVVFVRRQHRGDIRYRVEGRSVLFVGQDCEDGWRVESADYGEYGLPRAVLYLLRVPPGMFG